MLVASRRVAGRAIARAGLVALDQLQQEFRNCRDGCRHQGKGHGGDGGDR